MSITIAYSHKGGFWKTKYTYLSGWFARVGRKFFSGKASSDGKAAWRHNSDSVARTSFYQTAEGSAIGSGISVSFNEGVSQNKIYKSFSLEGSTNISGANTFTVNSDSSNVKQTTMGPLKNKGGILYGHIGLSDVILDSSNINSIGRVSVAAGDMDNIQVYSDKTIVINSSHVTQKVSSSAIGCKYLFLVKVSGGAYKLFDASGTEVDSSALQGGSVNNISGGFYAMSKEPAPAELGIDRDILTFTPQAGSQEVAEEGQSLLSGLSLGSGVTEITILEVTQEVLNGAPPRGQYAQMNISLGSDPYELHALNLNYEPTSLDHSK